MFTKTRNNWVVAADSAKAKIYEWNKEHKNLIEVTFIEDMDARKSEQDLKADRPGHGKGFASQVSYSMEDTANYKQQASQAFLKRLAQLLNEAGEHSKYDSLTIIASEDIYQCLCHNLSDISQNKIIQHYAKNLANMPASDLTKYYIKNLP